MMTQNCAPCRKKDCYRGKDCAGGRAGSARGYSGRDLQILRTAGEIESRHYMTKNRLEELVLFARRMGFRRLGIAFCIGLEDEARLLQELLEREFEVRSVCCKVGGIGKSRLGIPRLHPGTGVEASCNPKGQAALLNRERTELNIVLGLCMGHDILFTRHSRAPVTVLAVKDRVLAHNPLGALYSGYHRKRLRAEMDGAARRGGAKERAGRAAGKRGG